jgi:hypothetical protein
VAAGVGLLPAGCPPPPAGAMLSRMPQLPKGLAWSVK